MTDFNPFTPQPPVATPPAPPATEPAANGRRKRGPRRVPGAAKAAKKPGRPPKSAAAPAATATVEQSADDFAMFLFLMGHLNTVSKKSATRIVLALTKVFA